ncbi:MAG: hypothetical protein ACSHW1_15265 [Yoonia sp.]|uniref:hypothetical protein n=1 Tax=Yoonia sp. TaxID=2212373 RepID=UPI003EF40556
MTLIETMPLLRSARLMRHALLLILATLIAAAAILVVRLITDLPQTGSSLATVAGYGSEGLRTWQSAALGAILLLHMAIWGGVAWCGRQIFSALLVEDVQAASIAARKTASLLWIMLIWGIATNTLGPIVATWHFIEGQRVLAVGFGSAQVSTMLAALLATFISHAFVLGAALWQDHQRVI